MTYHQFKELHTPIFEYEGEHKLKRVANYGLFGEDVKILDEENSYYLIETVFDNYKGLIKKEALEASQKKTHYVCVRDTLIFSKPNIKEPLPIKLSYGMRITFSRVVDEKFILLSNGFYGIKTHFLALNTVKNQDYVSIAEEIFLSSPYLWGGRSPDGIDCSGVVQMACYGAGITTPRDSSPQSKFFTKDVMNDERKRGDIIFWKGHVGIMVDDKNFLHANAHHMKCVIEPFEDVLKRSEVPILGIKRFN